MWQHPAGLHCRAMLPDRSAAPLPAAKHCFLLHLDPGCWLCKGYGPKQSIFWSTQRTANKSSDTFHLLSTTAATTRGGTVPVHVPVRRRELHRKPWLSVCGWHSLWVRQSASVWLDSCLFKRHMSGGDDSAWPNRRNLPLRLMLHLNMLVLCHQLFGCDGVLHSGKVRDVCGECDGDGSTCTMISGTFTGGQARGSAHQYQTAEYELNLC